MNCEEGVVVTRVPGVVAIVQPSDGEAQVILEFVIGSIRGGANPFD